MVTQAGAAKPGSGQRCGRRLDAQAAARGWGYWRVLRATVGCRQCHCEGLPRANELLPWVAASPNKGMQPTATKVVRPLAVSTQCGG